MGVDSPDRVSTQTGAVFLSYASEDTEAAQKICVALRAAGIDVWFDQSELRGGDAWDRQIRERIHDCRLFIALISGHTEGRDEGYFRREWKLAVDRTHDMLDKKAFLLPVVIDGTLERGAAVPEKFHELQWTRLPGGETPAAFVDRIKRLLSPPTTTRSPAEAPPGSSPIPITTGRPSPWRRALRVVVAVLFVAALAYGLISKPWISKPAGSSGTSNATSSPAASSTAFSPPPHSIAVLPFVNMSGDKEQEYFSDGLSEELLNSLARINELQVAARTSSFYFKGEHTDLATIAHKLNVASVLEGSVRRSGNTVRVTAQLNNAVTGFHLWSQTYDRDLGDVLKLQAEIANAVASALKVTLLSDLSAKIELGGTRSPAAFDAYLSGSKAYGTQHNARDLNSAVAAYSEAIGLDPNYALAFAGRSMTLDEQANEYETGTAQRVSFDKALADAHQAIALAPELGEAHLALARVLEDGFFDFAHARAEYSRALSLAPGNARVLQRYGWFEVNVGSNETGIAAMHRAVVLDPLSTESHSKLGEALWVLRRYTEAVATFDAVIAVDPDASRAYGWRGFAYYGLGDLQSARSSCEAEGGGRRGWALHCLALVYDKLGRRADAEAMVMRSRAEVGDRAAYQYAEVYAQWGNAVKALEWLDTAVRLRDPGLVWLKRDPLLDPLRKEPRFQAIERELKFPSS